MKIQGARTKEQKVPILYPHDRSGKLLKVIKKEENPTIETSDSSTTLKGTVAKLRKNSIFS